MTKMFRIIILLLFTLTFVSGCGSDNNVEDSEETTIEIPKGSFPIVDKTFQFAWAGAYNQSSASFGFNTVSCDNNYDINTASSVTETYYNGMHNDTVMITYNDVGVNTSCGTGSGITNSGDTVSSGFVVFNKKTSTTYPYISLTGNDRTEFLNYVSVLKFSLSATSTNGTGLKLYKSINGGTDQLVGTYMPKKADEGEYFSVKINSSNVCFKFAPADDNTGFIRMHDLQIYSEGVSENATLLTEEYFNNTTNWSLQNYASYPSQIPYVDYIPSSPESDPNVKGITFIPLALYQTVSDITKSITYSSGQTVNYTIKDGAVNPYCYNHHGNLSLVYGLTKGYIDLPVQKNSYPRKDIDASLTISEFPSVSLAEFWLSTDSMDCNHEIYYKTAGMSDYKLLTQFIIDKYAGIGKYIRVWVNAKNVSFKITPGEGSKDGTGVLFNRKYIGIERKTKVHGIRIWSE